MGENNDCIGNNRKFLSAGCATKTLITKDSKTYTRTAKVTLVEDNVVAFGQPAQATSNLPRDSIVIAGQKNSYILTQGGSQFATIINKLDPKNIQITRDLNFFSEKMTVIFRNIAHFLCQTQRGFK